MARPRLKVTSVVLNAPDARELAGFYSSGAHAISVGAVLAEHQPQTDVRVYYDPAGHPFCMWTNP